jgi:adenylylsulfate kinase-like enzyme/cytochrome c2
MADKLSSTEHKKIFDEKIVPKELKDLQPVKKPTLFMLGGQPGAGKTNVRKAIQASDKGKGSAVIDPDDLRTYHPQYTAFVKDNADTAASRVHEDAMAWARELRAKAMEMRLNVVFDGTLGSTGGAKSMAKEASKNGYDIEVHVIATSLEVSQQSVRGRYEQAYDAYKKDPDNSVPPRNVPESIQRNTYNNIPGTLEDLCKMGVVSRMCISNRSGDKLNDVVGKSAVKEDGGKTATSALKKERTRPWTQQELDEYVENGEKIEGLMQTRHDNTDDKDEKKKIKDALKGMKKTRQDVTAKKSPNAQGITAQQNLWIKRVFQVDLADV